MPLPPTTEMPASQKTERREIVLGTAEGRDLTVPFRHLPNCAEGFLMDSRGVNPAEEPVHRVVVNEDFWMAETPVPQAQFALWTRAAGIEHTNHFDGNPAHPAESMTPSNIADG